MMYSATPRARVSGAFKGLSVWMRIKTNMEPNTLAGDKNCFHSKFLGFFSQNKSSRNAAKV